MAKEERPDRIIVENQQPVLSQPVSNPVIVPVQTLPSFFNNGDVLVDIDGSDIDFYYVVSVEDNRVILNNGEGPLGIKTKLVRKLVQSGAWKVYTEGKPKDTVPPTEKVTNKKNAKPVVERKQYNEERPNRL